MMKKILLTYFLIVATICLYSCKSHKLHHAIFYKKLGKDADKDGFHHNEAQRVLDYNETNKEANKEHAEETQQELGKNLDNLNKPNTYNSKQQKTKKKRFAFYM